MGLARELQEALKRVENRGVRRPKWRPGMTDEDKAKIVFDLARKGYEVRLAMRNSPLYSDYMFKMVEKTSGRGVFHVVSKRKATETGLIGPPEARKLALQMVRAFDKEEGVGLVI